jgi:hypothetical protein
MSKDLEKLCIRGMKADIAATSWMLRKGGNDGEKAVVAKL